MPAACAVPANGSRIATGPSPSGCSRPTSPAALSRCPHPPARRWLLRRPRHRPHRDLLRRHLRPPRPGRRGCLRSPGSRPGGWASPRSSSPVAFRNRAMARPPHPQADRRGAGRGLFLALHFATWISCSKHAPPVASAPRSSPPTRCGSTLLSHLPRDADEDDDRRHRAVLRRPDLFIFWSDSQTASAGSPMFGNLLALVGSWCFSATPLIGRRLAPTGLRPTSGSAYGAAALSCSPPAAPERRNCSACRRHRLAGAAGRWRSDHNCSATPPTTGRCATCLPPSSRWSRWASDRWAAPGLRLRRRLRAAAVRGLQPAADVGIYLAAKRGPKGAGKRLTRGDRNASIPKRRRGNAALSRSPSPASRHHCSPAAPHARTPTRRRGQTPIA